MADYNYGYREGRKMAKEAGYAKGGKVKHADVKQDKKLIRAEVKKALPPKMAKKVQKLAAGGAAKVRKGVATPAGKPMAAKVKSRAKAGIGC